MLRAILLVLGATVLGAIVGAWLFLAVLHESLVIRFPRRPWTHTDGGELLFDAGVALLGMAIGGALGAVAGVAEVLLH